MVNYLILFSTAFIAATLLPMQSEAVLLSMLALSNASPIILLLSATVGNVLGSTVNWWLGRQFERYKDRSWFPISSAKIVKAQAYYHKYGSVLLLLSWLPIIGDPITLVAGFLKARLWLFLLLVSLAKGGRYYLIYLVYLGVLA